MTLWLAIVYQVAVLTFSVHQIRAQDRYSRAHYDLKHCAFGPDGLTRYCLPKDGCWLLDAHGAAACWRVAHLEIK